MKKYKYNINNLDCAACAREIEEMLNKHEDFSNATVNFNTCKIAYESNKDYSLEELNDLVRRVEPECFITLEEKDNRKEFSLRFLVLALAIGLSGYFLPLPKVIKIILYLISYSMLLYRTTINAVKLLFKGNGINENALMTISCLGALALGEVLEGMMVIALYTIGKILEEKAINNSRKSIKDLLDIKEPYVNLKVRNKIEQIRVEDVKLNDILVVKKGEKIPVDGVVVKGSTLLDTSALTGESDLESVNIKSNVISGSINMGEVIEIKATKTYDNSTVSKVLELLDSATDKKTKTETLVSKISKIYTPSVIIMAVLIMIFLPIFTEVTIKESIYRGLTFLVISCPCAIAISIPLSYFTGIGVSSKKGILIKGSNYLDNLSNTSSVIFDKTGTLTNGTFNVSKIEIEDSRYNYDEIIDILIKGESFSNHPIAKSILKLKSTKVDNSDVKDFREIEGQGITFKLGDKSIFIGNKRLCSCNHECMLHLNINGSHVASISIDDGIKDDAKETISKLKSYGIKTYMFTGDRKENALVIGHTLGIDASDIVLMSDEVDRIPLAIDISKYTKYIIKENLIFALSVKVIILLLSVFGLANMWLAVFGDTGVTLLTILNTLRIMKKYR